MTDFNLANKVAIVTGSTQGIGRATALMLAEHDVSVFLNGRDKNLLVQVVLEWQHAGLTVDGVAGDISKESFVKSFVQRVLEKAGHIDILVNNAGISELGLIEDINAKKWDTLITNNLKSAFLMTRAVTPIMKRQRNGKIVNITSIVGLSGRTGGSHYVASKSGLIGLTKALARELGSFNIQVNAVAPGLTKTESALRNFNEEFFDSIAQRTPLGRIAEPQDIAKVVLFLVSPLSDFITSQVIVVDGGFLM